MDQKILDLATQWLNDHRSHVQKLSEGSKIAMKPVGEDYFNPALWKGCHWNWFLVETKMELYEKKNFLNRIIEFLKS